MFSKLVGLGFIIALIAWLGGCSGMLVEKRHPRQGPKIVEEDLPDPRTPEIPRDQESSPGVLGGPLVPPPAEVPPGMDPGGRSPRRYIWKDRKGSQRGWEPSQAPSEKDK